MYVTHLHTLYDNYDTVTALSFLAGDQCFPGYLPPWRPRLENY
jgi:hypothetical protein